MLEDYSQREEEGVPRKEKKRVLIVVKADPEKSHRFAEALRVAAGLSMHPFLSVILVLKDDVLKKLNSGDFSVWMDSEIIESAWAELKENECPILSQIPPKENIDCLIQFDG
ncbi:hypothetical protein A946_03445 [Methylacidiphilum kamchatkense Kam1]|uniref:Universal stress protein family protein n=1 Tax=Methylacidiphilum kamchatkense Kam1 TaxID=1202785 RepID=A0A0C1RLZ7_9BACT|nr:hypothetical protein [Methylacidiphilum kamchatkense]KIE59087.1 hypothetical protein A946_03445 [Methylacidiphilum kamchatkense Kam1]QDQ43000.1 hypothetical protein kam1_1786 [Methylacidiphilum kamchatkense Kam1]